MTWRSFVGLESSRDVFRRYKQIRERERVYLDAPDPLPAGADMVPGTTAVPITVLRA
jgi:hypothetical protein